MKAKRRGKDKAKQKSFYDRMQNDITKRKTDTVIATNFGFNRHATNLSSNNGSLSGYNGLKDSRDSNMRLPIGGFSR